MAAVDATRMSVAVVAATDADVTVVEAAIITDAEAAAASALGLGLAAAAAVAAVATMGEAIGAGLMACGPGVLATITAIRPANSLTLLNAPSGVGLVVVVASQERSPGQGG